MDDPLFTSINTVGTKNMSSKFLAIPKKIHSNQSFILEQQFQESVGVPFDISSATATLYVAGFNNTLDRVALASGVLSDSGSGTTDTVTFTVPKDLIPTSLGSLPQRNPGNSVFFYILEDADSVLEFAQEVNVIDPSYNLQGTTDPSAATVTTQRNDLGNVEDTTIVTPPGVQSLGLAYVVGPVGATGDWAGQENNLATSNGSNWIFTLPEEGNFVFDLNLGAQKLFDGSLWNISSSGDMLASTYDPQAIGDDAFDRANMTGTQTASTISNFDTSVNANAAVVLNTAKLTNATHTGEVTGSGSLTVDSTVVTNKTTEVPVSGDFLLFSDTSDSGSLKKADASILTPSVAIDELTDVTLTAESQGALLYRNATQWVNLPAGTNGQFLKTQGSSANPAWEAIPGGGDMLESTYDPASVSEQLVGLTATQSLTNKTVNGVVLTSSGSASEVLNAAGNYIPVSGSGDVAGPASAVDENITVFDLTTGKVIKDSGVNISAVTANTAKISYTDAAAVALNTAKVTNANHTGDVTGATALTIAADAVTYDKIQNVVADNVILGNNSGAGGIVDELTAVEVRTIINVEDGADVTDSTNVNAAGATMNNDTDISGNDWFLDEDDLTSDSATKAPSQQSVKAYVDANSGGGGSSQNILIDGQINHWSNGTSFTADGYASDMFGFSEGGGAATVTQGEFTIGQTNVPDNPKYYTQHDQTSDGTSVEILYQRLADCTQYSGESVTFSFYGKVSSGTLDVTPAIRQNFGTGGIPSTEVETAAGAAATLTTTWQKLEATISIPSVSGKTIGTDADSDYLEFLLKADDVATTFTTQLANVAAIQGSSSFDGPWLSLNEERARILPYFQNYSSTIYALMDDDNSTSRRTTFPNKSEFCQIPTISHVSETGYSGGIVWVATKEAVYSNTSAAASTTKANVTNVIANARY